MRETSLQAYESEIRPKLGEKQEAVRQLLLAYPEGLTNAEIGELLEWTINRVTPRTNELVHFKDANGRPNPVLIDAGIRKCRVTGRTAHVWKLKPLNIPKVETSEVKPINQLQLI